MAVSMELTGGKILKKKLEELADKVKNPAMLRVGFFEKSRYPNGTSVAMIAAINEFGAPSRGQPPRPYFRSMIATKKNEWAPAIRDLLKANNYDAEKTLGIAGSAIAGQLRQSIVDTNSPPLAPSTVKRKGFDKTLIDTSVMINSVGFEVTTK